MASNTVSPLKRGIRSPLDDEQTIGFLLHPDKNGKTVHDINIIAINGTVNSVIGWLSNDDTVATFRLSTGSAYTHCGAVQILKA